MATGENGRIDKIEELLIKHDERMTAHDERMSAHDERMNALQNMQMAITRMMQSQDERMLGVVRALENTERLLVMEGDRIDRLDRIEARQNELFAEISEQLHKR
jgi:hypothetical protein